MSWAARCRPASWSAPWGRRHEPPSSTHVNGWVHPLAAWAGRRARAPSAPERPVLRSQDRRLPRPCATRCRTLSAARPRAAELHTAGAWPGRELGLDALVAEATQDPVEQGLVDGADDLGGAAGQGVERAVPQPQEVLVPPLGFVAELLEQLAGGGEGTLGPRPPEPSPLPKAGAELGPPGGGDPGGGGQWRLVGGCSGDGVDQELADQLIAAFGDGDLQLQVGGLVDLGAAANPGRSLRGPGTGAEQPGGDQLVEVEGGQATGDPEFGRRLVAAELVAAPDQAVQAPPQLVGQQGGRGQLAAGLLIGHVSRVTAGDRHRTGVPTILPAHLSPLAQKTSIHCRISDKGKGVGWRPGCMRPSTRSPGWPVPTGIPSTPSWSPCRSVPGWPASSSTSPPACLANPSSSPRVPSG